MAIVKIILEDGESQEEVQESLCKALSTPYGLAARYDDPLLDQIEQRWKYEYSKVVDKMIQEIIEELEEVRE